MSDCIFESYKKSLTNATGDTCNTLVLGYGEYRNWTVVSDWVTYTKIRHSEGSSMASWTPESCCSTGFSKLAHYGWLFRGEVKTELDLESSLKDLKPTQPKSQGFHKGCCRPPFRILLVPTLKVLVLAPNSRTFSHTGTSMSWSRVSIPLQNTPFLPLWLLTGAWQRSFEMWVCGAWWGAEPPHWIP